MTQSTSLNLTSLTAAYFSEQINTTILGSKPLIGRLLPMESFNIQYSTITSPILPLDILALIIDTVGEDKDVDLLKKLALVSHRFLQICNIYLFSTIELYDAAPTWRASSKKGFVKLLKSRPDVVKHIRKLTYNVSHENGFSPGINEDQLLSAILPNFLKTIPHLKCLEISAAKLDWNTLDSSLTSAFLYLMHLPNVNYIKLSFINNFPLSSLTPCVNLHQLDIFYLKFGNDFSESLQSEIPRIRQFYTSDSSELTSMMLRAKRRDGRPAFDFTDLRQLSMSFTQNEDKGNIRHLLQTAKLLDKLHLFVERDRLTLEGLHDILSPSARTLKILELTVPLCYEVDPPLAGLCLCRELEAMAGHNVLETLAFQVDVDGDETADFIGSRIQKVENVLVKPGWSALKQVYFKISIACCLESKETSAKLKEALQSLPDKYLSQLSKLDSVTLTYSADIVKCVFELD